MEKRKDGKIEGEKIEFRKVSENRIKENKDRTRKFKSNSKDRKIDRILIWHTFFIIFSEETENEEKERKDEINQKREREK